MSRSKMFVAGLLLLGLLSIGDVLTPVLTDGQTPPMSIALMASGLGLVSLACIFGAMQGSRPALAVLVVARGVSALAAVPAFFVPDVPSGVRAAAGLGIAITLVGVALTLGGRRRLVSAR